MALVTGCVCQEEPPAPGEGTGPSLKLALGKGTNKLGGKALKGKGKPPFARKGKNKAAANKAAVSIVLGLHTGRTRCCGSKAVLEGVCRSFVGALIGDMLCPPGLCLSVPACMRVLALV